MRRTFMMPFQLSPVATRNSVRNATPKLRKWACRLRPSHGCFWEHSVQNENDFSIITLWHSVNIFKNVYDYCLITMIIIYTIINIQGWKCERRSADMVPCSFLLFSSPFPSFYSFLPFPPSLFLPSICVPSLFRGSIIQIQLGSLGSTG